MKPKLQLALDLLDLPFALQLSEMTLPWVDWIEAGTPLIINEGLKSVTQLKNKYPQKLIVADVKIADAAKLITQQVINAQADILTVLSAASDSTIKTCVDGCHQKGCLVLGDHISNDLSASPYQRLIDLGVDYVGIHIPKDSSDVPPLSAVEQILQKINFPVVLAGGIDITRLEKTIDWPVSTFVVGGAIINHPNPAAQAQKMSAILDKWS